MATTHVPSSDATQGDRTQSAKNDDIVGLLQELPKSHPKFESLIGVAFRRIVAYMNAPFAMLQLDSASGVMEDLFAANPESAELWKRAGEGMLLQVRYRDTPLARAVQGSSSGEVFAYLAVPIRHPNRGIIGSTVVVVPTTNSHAMTLQLRELRALTGMLGCLATEPARTATTSAGNSTGAASASLAKAGNYESLTEMAFALANQIKGKSGADSVALGIVRGTTTQMLCLSGLDQIHPRSPGWRCVQQAMDECLDAGRIVCFQRDPPDASEPVSTGHRIHRNWSDQAAHAPVASIPVRDSQGTIAIVSLRNPVDRPFRADQLRKIEEALGSLAAGFRLMQRADRSVVRHLSDVTQQWKKRHWTNASPTKRCVAALVIALGMVGTFGRMTYIVSAPCGIVAQEAQHIAAPFDGQLREVFVEPGHAVRAGQILAKMDIRELTADAERLRAEMALAEVELARAVTSKDVAASAMAESKAELARSQLRLVELRMDRAEIRSPLDGVILSSELRQRVGQMLPIGEPLFVIGAADSWAIEVKVPESAVRHLNAGLNGSFVTLARPHESIECSVEYIEGAARTDDGQNVFVARGALTSTSPEWLRAGMAGYVRIDAGRRPIWWIWLHRVIDSVRWQLWKL